MAHAWRGAIEEYRDWLPVNESTPVVTIREGGTPLVHSPWLSSVTGGDVYLKFEGANPTGSFKDRGMTVAVSKAVERGDAAVVCASTGNTSASASAYAARAGLTSIVLIPQGKVTVAKMTQSVVHGASIVQVEGNFDDCLRLAQELSETYPVALVNSVNPYRLAGQKTAAFEVIDALGRAPDHHVLPVGNAGNISAYWMGYVDAVDGQYPLADSRPVMWGFQAAGSAPLVEGAVVAHPDTVASAIRIGNPASWKLALAARDESGGSIEAVTDTQILSAQQELARRDGLFVEPASASGIAGVLARTDQGRGPAGTIVITVTGHGLKDVETANTAYADQQPTVIPNDVHRAAQALGLA